ncbi:aspartate/glutamate racemase family protein [Microbacterium sp.]|uniref:aspartate/glutamate racemase family protein n=1 Tax=Microbacterium sp. TaxID=51671 RepID=UPI0039E59D0C
MRITLINPNTSRAMTAKIADAAREVAGPDVEIVVVCPAEGAAAIESHVDEVAAARAVIELIEADVDAGGSDGYVVACFGDPGLDAARELVDVPVVGIAEAAMHVAALSGRSFAVVTTLSRTLGRAGDLLARYGMERACVALEATGIPVLDLEDTASLAVDTIVEVAAQAVASARADVIVLGCAGMADLCATVSRRVGVPVVDGVAAAVGLVAAMSRMGVGTSTRDEYAAPPRRPAPGVAARSMPVALTPGDRHP